jgi:type IV secretion system protein VirB10
LAALSATTLREIPLAPAPSNVAYGAPPVKTAAQLELERQLSGAVFSPQSSPTPVSAPISSASFPPGADLKEPGELSALVRPSVTTAVRAQVLPTQRLLLPKGAFLDCTLETAIDSTLPGMTTCVMATDTFGVDGQVVLLERGTKLVGETRGQVQQGSARVFVLWDEARTPAGVIVPLASPGADELGRSGLPGSVDRHFLGTLRRRHAGVDPRRRHSGRGSIEPRQQRHRDRQSIRDTRCHDGGAEGNHQHSPDGGQASGRPHPGTGRAGFGFQVCV